MVRKASSKSAAALGFEVTAVRTSAIKPREAILRSLSEAKDNLRNTFSSTA